jgi:hypothetical protein
VYADANAPDEQRLMMAMLHNYEPASRPVYNASNVVLVKFGLTLAQIFDMVRFSHNNLCLSSILALIIVPILNVSARLRSS